jgi:putative tryptophan/tyrosine transport system substrate-binding protein
VIARRALARIALALAPALLLPCVAAAQAPPPVARIGYLTGGELSTRGAWLDVLRAGLREHGWREGENLVLEMRGAGGRFERLPELARELLVWDPHVLLVSTTPAALVAKQATATVPIVILAVADPVGVGLVSNLARPSENITGVSNASGELPGKRLELLHQLLPSARRVAVIVNPDDPNAQVQMTRSREAATQLGIELAPIVPLRSLAELDAAFRLATEGGAQAALRLVDPLASIARRDTVSAAAAHRLPVVYAFREDVEAGGLIAYGTVQAEQYRRAAYFAHRLLTGASPQELPVELPTRFELLINLRTAQALGITVPPTLLARADEILE